MENTNLNQLFYSNKNDKSYNFDYSNSQTCNCCNCINSYGYCYCQCHKNKYKENNDIDFENAPNLNINELKMKSLKDYSYNNQNINLNNNYNLSLKNMAPSKSTSNIGNFNTGSNGKHLLTLKKKIENNVDRIKSACMNKSKEGNYINGQKNRKTNNKANNLNDSNDLNFKEVANHYKTQSNFNTLRKYYQLNNNMNSNNNNNNYNKNNSNLNYNNTLKSQIEFNKLLNSIKGNDNNINNNINNINSNISQLEYNNFTERENRHYTKINGYNNNAIRGSNNSSQDNLPQINNMQRNSVNYNRNNRILEKYQDSNNSNFNIICSSTEYNKPFRSLNICNDNSINLSNKEINNNFSIQLPQNAYLNNFNSNINNNNNINNNTNIKNNINYSSRNSLLENNNISNINQNDGNTNMNSPKKLRLDDDSISYNTSALNKSYNKLLQNLDANSNSNNCSILNNISHTEPRYSNSSKNSENDNVNIKLNYLETNSSQNENENKNELLESKEINGDNNNNNFIVTFGARGSNEIKNIIASVKNDLNSPNNIRFTNKNKEMRNENPDQKINNIIIDYENLKKRYAPNKLFTGLQNNIKDLNENINLNQNLNLIADNYSNKSTINSIKNINNYSKYKFDIYLKGDINKNKALIEENEKYKEEINGLSNQLKESKNKIDELTKIITDYQKEIYSLKTQLTRSKKESLNESKNTFNNISTSNYNINSSNKTKIGKDSFIIKIPENLKRNNLNKDRRSRNNSLSNKNNTYTYSNVKSTNRKMQDKYINLYSNIHNISNQISNISHNTNSNCFTYNNINISSNNISCNNIANNKEIYVKKITTTMKRKFKKSASQKIRINKVYINNNLSFDCINKDITNTCIDYSNKKNNRNDNFKNRFIYSLFQKENRLVLLGFDVIKKQFHYVNFSDYDNFGVNYSESFYRDNRDNSLNNNSIFSNDNNNFYIITGKNTDILYIYNNDSETINKLCKFKENHAKGCLLSFDNKLFCLSGNHNKKVEIFFIENKKIINLEEMNVERSNFAACVIQNKYIFALFGYNYPTQQYLDTIEFYELKNIGNYKKNYYNSNNNEFGWKYLQYNNNSLLNLNIEGHSCFNYNDEKIIFFGGFNAVKNNAENCIYELLVNGDTFNDEFSNRGIYVDKLDKKLSNIYKNGCYFFGNNNGFIFEEQNSRLMFATFDNNSFLHILDIENLRHNVYSFE